MDGILILTGTLAESLLVALTGERWLILKMPFGTVRRSEDAAT